MAKWECVVGIGCYEPECIKYVQRKDGDFSRNSTLISGPTGSSHEPVSVSILAVLVLNGKIERRILTTDFTDFTDFKRVIKTNWRNLPSPFG